MGISTTSRLTTILFGLIFYLTALHGEVEKFAVPNSNGLQFYWWPKLPPIPGWHQEQSASFHYGINAHAPDGSNFGNAKSVIYARAIYKPRAPELKTLAAFIESDKKDFLRSTPDIEIKDSASAQTADGKKLQVFTFSPKTSGNWECVTYGEEGDFYLVFTLSSRTKKDFDAAIDTYKKLLSLYKEK